MQINAINNSNLNQNTTTTSFKSVIPVKVFVNNYIASNERTNYKAFRELYRILRKPKNDSEQTIRTKFIRTVQDYKIHTKPNKKLITSSCIDGQFYIFTGEEADKLAEYSHKIGLAQREGLERSNTSDTYEANIKKQEFFKFAKKLISSNAQLKELKSVDGKVFWGERLGLHINAESTGLPGKKGYKFEIITAPFRHIKENFSKAAEQPAKTEVKPTSSKKTRGKKKTADWPARAPKPDTSMPKGPEYLDFD